MARVIGSKYFFKTFEEIFTYYNLYNAVRKAKRKIGYKNVVKYFLKDKNINVLKLYEKIKNGTYQLSPAKEKIINERGKERFCRYHSFKDKIVQRCFCDNYFTKLVTDRLIYDCPATVLNKGTHWAKKRNIHHLNEIFIQTHSNKGWVLKIDIKSYFDEINHDILKKKLNKIIFNEKNYKFAISLIDDNKLDSRNKKPEDFEKGIMLGSQMSQLMALLYLNDLDHYIKEKLGIKWYIRYMDDLVLIHKDRKYLYKCLNVIITKLHELKLHINQSKTKITSLSHGFEFLKTKIKMLPNGKIIKKLAKPRWKNVVKKMKKGVCNKFVWLSFIEYHKQFNCHNKFIKFCKKYNKPCKILSKRKKAKIKHQKMLDKLNVKNKTQNR